ncbi:MAG: S8 family serine peptidase [Bacteroidota bacterium]
MKIKRYGSFLFFIILLTQGGYAQKTDHVPGELLIKLYHGEKWVDHQLEVGQRRLFLRARKCLSEPMDIYLITFDPRMDADLVCRQLRKEPQVAAVQLNHYVTSRHTHATFPNDTEFSSQWHLHNTGQIGTADADIDAPEAWDLYTSSQTALGDEGVVAVIDDGFDLNHSDLNFWTNDQEIPNNGIDDDQNGYIDDFLGWNAYNSTGFPTIAQHGTQVAGIIGAKTDNQLGVAGVGWGIPIMAVGGASSTESVVVEAYNYILQQRILYEQSQGVKGAFVVATNASFGVDFGTPQNFPIWCSIYDSLGAYGIMNIAAAMNIGANVDMDGDIPTTCQSDWLLTVTSTNADDQRVMNAGFGPIHVDIAAPGNGIYTTYASDAYGPITGTSFAAPQVAGAYALMLGYACPSLAVRYRNDPAGVSLLIKDLLLQSVDTLPTLLGNVLSEGRLNAFRSLQAIQSVCANLDTTCIAGYNLVADVLTDTTVLLAWQQLVDSVEAKVRWRVLGDTTWTDSAVVDSQTLLVTGLSRCQVYEAQVATRCDSGWSSFSQAMTFETLGCCVAPQNLQVVQKYVSPSGLAWVLTWDSVYLANDYTIELKEQFSPDVRTFQTGEDSLFIEGINECSTYEVKLYSDCDLPTVDTLIIEVKARGCGPCVDLDYCESRATQTDFEWIESIEIGGDKQVTGQGSGYSLTTDNPFSLVSGLETVVVLTPGFSGLAFTEAWRIWIDLDGSGTFDSTELMLAPEPSSGVIVDTMILPFDVANLGEYRMRVSMRWVGFTGTDRPQACSVFTNGEVEDYCMNFIVLSNETENLTSGKIFPNPFIDQLEIASESPIQEIQMWNVTGYRVFQQSFLNLKEIQIPTSHLPTGVYFVQVKTSMGIWQEKVVRN